MMTMTELAPIVELLERQIGMAANTVGPRTIESALRRRMDATKTRDVNTYITKIRTDRQELVELVDTVVVPETWFFRYPDSFKFLALWANDKRNAYSRSRPLRILSIPCCTGEEPYSIAMCLVDAGFPISHVKIEGVDVSQRLLEYAASGVYGNSAFRDSGDGYRERFFEAKGNGNMAIKTNIRMSVTYKAGNVADSHFLANEPPYDIIFCRNLFIYLTDSAKRIAVSSLNRLLAPDGLIFMGHAEPLGLVDSRFKSTGPAQAFVFTRSAAGNSPSGITSVNAATNAAAPSPSNHGGPLTLPAKFDFSALPSLNKSSGSVATALSNLTGGTDLLAQAKLAANAGKANEAITHCEKYLQTNASNAEAHALLGVAHIMLNDNPTAELHFTRALYLNPTHYESLIHMMAISERKGDFIAAANFRRRAGGTGRTEGKK